MSKSDEELTANQQNAIKNFKYASLDQYTEWYKIAWNDVVEASK